MKKIIWIILVLVVGYFVYRQTIHRLHPNCKAGIVIDQLDNVKVYCNGNLGVNGGRTLTKDGYNIGLKYECVEFVKRYYYEHYHHKMPDAYGNAKDFFNSSIKDGNINRQRGLYQYTNGSKTKPKKGDILVLDATSVNQFGHIVIISEVLDDEIEVIQQNSSQPRDKYDLDYLDGQWYIDSRRALGWLRMTE